MDEEKFLAIIDDLVKTGRIYVICDKCRHNVTKNYMNPFNCGKTRCDHCNEFRDNEKILYVSTKAN